MSKTLSGGMQTLVAGGALPLAWAATFTRADGQVFRYTSAQANATVGGNTYAAAPGFDVSSISCTLGYDVDTLQLTVLTTSALTVLDFLAGRWDACRVEFSQFDWVTPANGFIAWPAYSVANVEPMLGGFRLELRDLREYLQQDVTLITGRECPHRLGDAACAVNTATFTHAFTVTGVTSRQVFTCSALAQAADYFTAGFVTFAAGTYAGLPLLVADHAAGGVLTLAIPLWADVSVGATGSIVAGCTRRFDEDCKTKFANVLNFGGQKDAPTVAKAVGAED